MTRRLQRCQHIVVRIRKFPFAPSPERAQTYSITPLP